MVLSGSATLEALSHLGPMATALAAIVALLVGSRTITQRTRADARDQWWKRAQWAFELTVADDDERREIGLRTMLYLAVSELAGRDETVFMEIAWKKSLDESTIVDDTGDRTEGGGHDVPRAG